MRYPLLLCPLIVLSSPAAADLVESTLVLGAGATWSDPSWWTHSLPGLEAYPDNGLMGHTYIANVGGIVSLDGRITIEALQMTTGGAITGSGSLDVIGTGAFASATGFYGGSGTCTLAAVDAFGMRIEDWSVTAPTVNVGSPGLNGGITLDGNGTLTVSGALTFLHDGDVTTIGGDGPLLTLEGGSVVKAGAVGPGGVSDITTRIMVDGGEIDAEQGMIRFPVPPGGANGTIDLTNAVFRGAPGTAIVFVRSANMTGTVGVMDSAHVTFQDGDHVLTGSIDKQVDAVVEIAGGTWTGGSWFGTGLLQWTGGVVNDVTNDGTLRWGAGTVGSGGFTNSVTETEGAMTVAAIGSRTIAGSFVDFGLFEQGHRIDVATQTPVDVRPGGEWVVSGSARLVDTTAGPIPARFDATSATVRRKGAGLEGTFDIDTRLDAATIAVETQSSLVFAAGRSAVVTGCTMNLAADAEVVFEGPAAFGGTTTLNAASGATVELFGADHTLTGIITDGGSGAGEMGVSNGATLSGGGVTLGAGDGAAGLVLDDGTLTDVVTTGRMTWKRGTVEGLTNGGLLDITGSTGSRVVGTGTLSNTGVARVSADTVDVLPLGDIVNQGTWLHKDFSTQLRSGDPTETVHFFNLGEFIADDAPALVDTRFDNQGTVRARFGAQLTFAEGRCVQFDGEFGALLGGTWRAGSGAVIAFDGGVPLCLVGDGATVAASGTGTTIFGQGFVKQVSGKLLYAGGAGLTLTEPSVAVEPEGELGDGEAVLGPTQPSTIDAQHLLVRGTLSVSSALTVTAQTGIDVEGGVVRGGGLVVAPFVDVSGGSITPGFDDPPEAAIGQLTIDADLTLDGGAELLVTLDAGVHDAVTASGEAILGRATLRVELAEGAEIEPSSTFDVLVAGTVTGAFDDVVAPPGYLVEHLSDRVRVISPACLGDLDGDGIVGFGDLLIVLSQWGTDAADLDGDGSTGFSDLLVVLSMWGPCA